MVERFVVPVMLIVISVLCVSYNEVERFVVRRYADINNMRDELLCCVLCNRR